MISSAGRLPNPPRAPYPDVANTALSRSVRNLFQMGSDMVVVPGFSVEVYSIDRSKARAHAFDEAHVDDLLIFDVGLEDAGLAYDRAAGGPGFLADHAVLAPHLIAK